MIHTIFDDRAYRVTGPAGLIRVFHRREAQRVRHEIIALSTGDSVCWLIDMGRHEKRYRLRKEMNHEDQLSILRSHHRPR